MGAFVFAWLTGEAIIAYRSVAKQHGPPWPGQLMLTTGLYIILAMIAQAGPGARRLSLTLAWGLNIAAFLNLYKPGGGLQAVLPGGNAATSWWANITKTCIPAASILPTATGGGTGGGQPAQPPPSNIYGSPSGPGIPPPTGVPVNPATGKCPPGYTYAYGQCWSPAVNPLPPGSPGSGQPAPIT